MERKGELMMSSILEMLNFRCELPENSLNKELEKQVETLDQHGEIENKVIASRELRIEVS
jgi:hypothetical protein